MQAAGRTCTITAVVTANVRIIAPSLCMIFNKSLQLGSLPSDWKLANVLPVHKKGAKDHVENHRPISLLPIVSKVFERFVLNSTKDHLYQVISPKQHGFCTGISCVTNLLEALLPHWFTFRWWQPG